MEVFVSIKYEKVNYNISWDRAHNGRGREGAFRSQRGTSGRHKHTKELQQHAGAADSASSAEERERVRDFSLIDVALLVNGKGGPGIVVSRTKNGWSGPLFVGLGGAGVGAQIGGK